MTQALFGCAGKFRFSTPKRAKVVAKRMARRKGHPVASYRCQHCGTWHVGESNGSRINWHTAKKMRERDQADTED